MEHFLHNQFRGNSPCSLAKKLCTARTCWLCPCSRHFSSSKVNINNVRNTTWSRPNRCQLRTTSRTSGLIFERSTAMRCDVRLQARRGSSDDSPASQPAKTCSVPHKHGGWDEMNFRAERAVRGGESEPSATDRHSQDKGGHFRLPLLSPRPHLMLDICTVRVSLARVSSSTNSIISSSITTLRRRSFLRRNLCMCPDDDL